MTEISFQLIKTGPSKKYLILINNSIVGYILRFITHAYPDMYRYELRMEIDKERKYGVYETEEDAKQKAIDVVTSFLVSQGIKNFRVQ